MVGSVGEWGERPPAIALQEVQGGSGLLCSGFAQRERVEKGPRREFADREKVKKTPRRQFAGRERVEKGPR